LRRSATHPQRVNKANQFALLLVSALDASLLQQLAVLLLGHPLAPLLDHRTHEGTLTGADRLEADAGTPRRRARLVAREYRIISLPCGATAPYRADQPASMNAARR
jgi:hypothetical protein